MVKENKYEKHFPPIFYFLHLHSFLIDGWKIKSKIEQAASNAGIKAHSWRS